MAMTIVDLARAVTGGVGTHLELNVAAAMDALGSLLGVGPVPDHRLGAQRTIGLAAGLWPGGPGGHRGHELVRGGPRPAPAGIGRRSGGSPQQLRCGGQIASPSLDPGTMSRRHKVMHHGPVRTGRYPSFLDEFSGAVELIADNKGTDTEEEQPASTGGCAGDR
jgi:hypothetical protein